MRNFLHHYAPLVVGSFLGSFLGFSALLGNPEKPLVAALIVVATCALSWHIQATMRGWRDKIQELSFAPPLALEDWNAREKTVERALRDGGDNPALYGNVLQSCSSCILDYGDFVEAIPCVPDNPYESFYQKLLMWGLVAGLPGAALTLCGFYSAGFILSALGAMMAPQGLLALRLAKNIQDHREHSLKESMSESWNVARAKAENILHLETLLPEV